MPMPSKLKKYLLFSVFVSSGASFAQEPPTPAVPMINITAGQVAVFDNELQSERYGLEYRSHPLGKYQIIPAVGFAFSDNGDSFVYSDLRHDFWLNDKWVFTPSIGAGFFTEGNIDLGMDLEFRSGIELAYRFKNNYRLGVALFHLSNGGISNSNPGTEALTISLSIPLGK